MGECRVCEVNCLRETEQSKVIIQRTIVWVLKFPAICEDEVEDEISEKAVKFYLSAWMIVASEGLSRSIKPIHNQKDAGLEL